MTDNLQPISTKLKQCRLAMHFELDNESMRAFVDAIVAAVAAGSEEVLDYLTGEHTSQLWDVCMELREGVRPTADGTEHVFWLAFDCDRVRHLATTLAEEYRCRL